MKTTTPIELLEWILGQREAGFFASYIRHREERAFGKGLTWGLTAGFVLNVIWVLVGGYW